jgi:hypothetical protein
MEKPKELKLAEDEVEILMALISVRVMSTEQIRKIWFREKTMDAAWKRIRRMRAKKLIQRLEYRLDRRSIWTFTHRAVRMMARRVRVPLPKVRLLESSSVDHQLMIADAYASFYARETPYERRRRMRRVQWQDGSTAVLRFRRGYAIATKRPDVYLGYGDDRRQVAYLEIDRGTKSKERLTKDLEDYAHFFATTDTRGPAPLVVYICDDDARRNAKIRSCYESLSELRKLQLGEIVVLTVADVRIVFDRIVAHYERLFQKSESAVAESSLPRASA